MKTMIRKYIYLFLFVVLWNTAEASNVRIVKDVTIDPYTIQNGIATLDFKIAWDNSWRDNENWDAVYVFLKYKKGNEKEWKHVLLMDASHEFTNGYTFWSRLSPNGAVNRAQGVFIFREQNGGGAAEVAVKLKWMLSQNGLSQADFQNVSSGGVECRLMCIEMVYIPKGPFALGDKSSPNALGNTYNTILPEWDLIKNDDSMSFWASGDINSEHYRIYAPENAANRVNEGRNNPYAYDNAWYATTAGASEWGVDFGVGKTVRYFGINGVVYYSGYVPALWGLYGSNNKIEWTTLGTYNASDWRIFGDSYPITNAIKIRNPQSFRYYKVGVTTSSYGPMMNNISMTEVDLEASADQGYVVDKTNGITMDLAEQLGSADGDTWSGTLNGYYPSGYEGFYAMKYEVSQKQYVGFLNKLLLNQQKNRTIGLDLDKLSLGDYVYASGTSNHKVPAFRNGIVLAEKTDDRYIFACNLNASGSKDEYEKKSDGQDIACNFLSPADMLAYADWTGLRPMSELEYEKMGRALYPTKAKQREWAAGVLSSLTIPGGEVFSTPGTETEKLTSGNANIGNRVKGPVRCGSFAAGATSRTAAGSSYWGVMELSGNLAEIYYSLNAAGRPFQSQLGAHGDGILYADTHVEAGGTDFSAATWPRDGGAFILRGGSFKNLATKEGALSDRTFARSSYSDWNQKKEETTFRLGHSCTYLVSEPCTTYLKLENGRLSTSDNAAYDTVCSGSAYKIIGSPLLSSTITTGGVTTDVVKEVAGNVNYTWYYCGGGPYWDIIPGATGKDLQIPAYTGTGINYLGNDSKWDSKGDRVVYFRRVATSPTLWSQTNYVHLKVITNTYKINSDQDVINKLDQINGLLVETKYPTDFTWSWQKSGGNKLLKNDTKGAFMDYLSVERDSFGNQLGAQQVICEMTIAKKCIRKQTFTVTIEAKPTTGVASGSITMANCGEVMKDTRDGQLYGTTKIGNQCWMAQNLNYTIPSVGSTKHTLFRTKDPDGKKNGALYNRSTTSMTQACPDGWGMPTNAEVNALNAFLSQDGLNRAGAKLKAGNYWNVLGGGRLNMGTNDYGFGAKCVGYNTNSAEEPNHTYWITYDNSYFYLSYNSTVITGPAGSASSYWMPLRCIKK